MPQSRGGGCGNTQPPRGTACAGEGRNVGTSKSKAPGGEDQTCVSEATAVAVAASSSDPEEGSGPNCRPEEELDHRWPSRLSILATRYQAWEATACAFRTCSQ